MIVIGCDDFVKINFKNDNLTDNQIIDIIKDVITNWEIASNTRSECGNPPGYDRIYSKEDKFYILVGVGFNGFVITAHPLTKRKLIDKEEGRKNEEK